MSHANESQRVLGVGILGFGFIGKVHAYAHRNMPLFYDPPPVRTKLIGVATSRPETAAKAKQTLGFEIATTDARRIIEDKRIDIIHICTPNHLHKDAILAAMQLGKHIYCDKPLAADADQAARIVEALAGYRGTHQMTLQYRFLPATMRARQLVEQGFVGRVSHFRGAYLHSGSIDPNRALNWKADKASGGGVLHDLGSHILDLLWHLIGPFEAVCATKRVWAHERPDPQDPTRRVPIEAEDLAVMMLRTADGAIGTVEASKIATGTEDELRFEIHGQRGALRFNLMDPNWLEAFDATEPSEPCGGMMGWKRIAAVQRYPAPAGLVGPKNAIGWIRAHVACLHNFLSAIASGQKAEPGLEHGAALQYLMERAHESARNNTWVSC